MDAHLGTKEEATRSNDVCMHMLYIRMYAHASTHHLLCLVSKRVAIKRYVCGSLAIQIMDHFGAQNQYRMEAQKWVRILGARDDSSLREILRGKEHSASWERFGPILSRNRYVFRCLKPVQKQAHKWIVCYV